MASGEKSAGAFRTIGEVATATGVAAHILRYWESRFPQLRPVTRAGGRRYYRPDDVALVRRIDRLLNSEGYTIRGVQRVLAGEGGAASLVPDSRAEPGLVEPGLIEPGLIEPGLVAGEQGASALRQVRDLLAQALDAD